MKITNFRGIQGVVLENITQEEVKEVLQKENMNIYGLRHSDNDTLGKSPTTIEVKEVKVNKFGIFVTPSKINFGKNDYLELTTNEKISFGKSKIKEYTTSTLVENLKKIKSNNTKQVKKTPKNNI